MKVRVSLTIDVAPADWANAAGELLDADGSYDLSMVRENLASYIFHQVASLELLEEAGATVTRS